MFSLLALKWHRYELAISYIETKTKLSFRRKICWEMQLSNFCLFDESSVFKDP